jgi:hypothetical protein
MSTNQASTTVNIQRSPQASRPPIRTPVYDDLTHSFVSLMSDNGVSIELIAGLVGHITTAATEAVYRHELRSAITDGANIIGRAFGAGD